MSSFCFVSSVFLNIDLKNPFVKVLLPILAITAVLLISKKRFGLSYTQDLYLRRPPIDQLLLWLAIDMIWMLSTNYFVGWRGPWNFTPWIAQPLYVSILRVLAVCFLGPISEELIFRGFLFSRLKKALPVNEWVIVIIIAAFWASIHYTYPLLVISIIFVDGVILGAALIRSRSLVIPMIMHICWNLYAIW